MPPLVRTARKTAVPPRAPLHPLPENVGRKRRINEGFPNHRMDKIPPPRDKVSRATRRPHEYKGGIIIPWFLSSPLLPARRRSFLHPRFPNR
jgi:hypothetical protein